MTELRPASVSPRRERQARAFFDTAASLFGALGLRDAERSIRHYRDGTGTDIRLNGRDIARHPLIDLGVRANRNRIETLSLLGRGKKENNDRLLGLKDGETITLEDDWARDFNFGYPKGNPFAYPKKLWEDSRLLTSPDSYLTFGRHGIDTKIKVSGRRVGDDLFVNGEATHSLDPRDARVDFNPDQPGGGPARVLERVGQAKPFNFLWSRKEPVQARVRFEPDGSLTLKSVNWGSSR